MAYTPNTLKEEEEQGQAPFAPSAPTISGPSVGSTPSFGGTASGSSPMAKQSGGRGTGFTNIDRYLAANKDAGSQVANAAKQYETKERTDFAKNIGTFNADVDKNTPTVDTDQIVANVLRSATPAPTPQPTNVPRPTAIVNNMTRGEGTATAPNRAPRREATPVRPPQQTPTSDEAVKAAQDVLAAQYEGPTQVGYNIGGTADAQGLRALGNVGSAGEQLASEAGPLARYNPQLSAIDRAIYGANAKKQIGAAKAASEGMTKEQASKVAAAEQKAGLAAGKIQGTKDELTKGLATQADRILSEAQTRAKQHKTQEENDQINGIVRDPTTGKAVPIAPGQQTVWEGGSDTPTATQFLTGGGVGALQNIGKVVGDENLSTVQQGPEWVSGRNAVLPSQPQGQVTVQDNYLEPLANDNKMMNWVKYQEYLSQGMTPEQATMYVMNSKL